MALEGVDIKTLSYSTDAQVWTVYINGNKYDFYGVNPYMKRKLNQYIKYNNKKEFFKLLRRFEYVNLTKKQKEKEEEKQSKEEDPQKKNRGGTQLDMFQEHIKSRLRSLT